MRLSLSLIVTLPLFWVQAVFAQSEPTSVEQTVIVRGTPLPVEDTSVWTQEVQGRDLDMEASGRVENAVRDLGATQFRRSDARSAHPTSQGLTLRGLGGNAASRVLVLVDGVPQADPFGGWVSWPGYDALPLASLTLERGGGTGAYGAGALAGTLSLSTREPGEEVDFGGEFLGGSRRSIVSRAHAALPTGPLRHLVGASAETSNGFIVTAPEQRGVVDESAPYTQAGAALRTSADVGGSFELHTSGRAFFDQRTRGTPFTENRNEGIDLSLRASAPKTVQPGWSALVYLQHREMASSFAAVDDERNSARRVFDQVRVPSLGLGARLSLSPDLGSDTQLEGGVDFRRVQGKTEEEYLFVDGAPERRRQAGGIRETGGLFGNVSWRLQNRLTLSAAGRVDFWHLHGGYRLERELGGDLLTDEEFAPRLGLGGTGRLGVGFDLSRAVHLRSASYTGYRLPTLNELYRPFRVGADATAANAALDPERLWGTEVGIDLRPVRGLRASVTAFENHLLGAITNVTLDEGPGMFDGVGFVSDGGAYRQRRNISSMRSLGLDASVTLDDRVLGLSGITWNLLYSLVRAEVRGKDQAAFITGLVPAQVPTHTAASTWSWSNGPDGTTLSSTLRYLGQQFEDDLNQIVLDSAWVLDVSAKVRLVQAVHGLLRIENFTNARVEAAQDASGLTELGAPRVIWVGLSYGL